MTAGGVMFEPDGTPTSEPFDPTATAAAMLAHRQRPYKLLKIADILAMEDPESLIEAMIPKAGMTVLFGPSGTFKSFVALDWALCVAAGVPWFGKTVQQAPVVYIAGEGLAGMKLRVEAWLLAHPGANPGEHFHLVGNAVNLLDTDEKIRILGALETVKEETGAPCGLLIVDTMARALVGGDENSAKDVGLFIANVDDVTRPLASLVVHHTGKDGAAERGSSALRGAADSMIRTERTKDKRKLTLKCEKSKDAEEFDDVALVVVPTAKSITFQVDLTPKHVREPDLKYEVLAYIARHDEPVHKSQITGSVKKRRVEVDEAVAALLFEEKIERVEEGRRVLFRVCPGRPGHSGTGSDSGVGGNPEGTMSRREGPRRGSSRDTVPEPESTWDDGTVSQGVSAEAGPDELADVDAGVGGSW